MTEANGKPCRKCGTTDRYQGGDCKACARTRAAINDHRATATSVSRERGRVAAEDARHVERTDNPAWQRSYIEPPTPATIIPTHVLRSVLVATRSRPLTAVDLASTLGIEYAVAFAAVEQLAALHALVPLTNGRWAVQPRSATTR
jgi:hypothetical protein